jgi:leucyl aminopeptidase
LKKHLVGLLSCAENLPDSKAYRPGDVVRTASGITVEIISTDAEGRMVLCDALHYARRFNPRAVVDIATLTGACVIALGYEAMGLMGNNDDLRAALQKAGDECGERCWPLPLWEEYDELIRSDVADIKNAGGRPAGAIVGGMFLKRFVKGLKWAHLDIAGVAWAEREWAYKIKGPTGAGVRILTNFVERF